MQLLLFLPWIVELVVVLAVFGNNIERPRHALFKVCVLSGLFLLLHLIVFWLGSPDDSATQIAKTFAADLYSWVHIAFVLLIAVINLVVSQKTKRA
ncbi:hypothetical protein [Hymenobacter edaphi]|uniref:hypothetical protein n=1 Tax=Hymenobacter edaphi TaxID=2211146 RepID=UPI001057AC94|nr:hypothetical protein [Hymenobacter edaphi]